MDDDFREDMRRSAIILPYRIYLGLSQFSICPQVTPDYNDCG